MRLIQRLAAGMCEARAQILRASATAIGRAARQCAWADLPARVQRLCIAAAVLHDRLEDVKAAIARTGFSLDYNFGEVKSRNAVSYKDAHDRQRKAEAVVEKRVEAIGRLKQQALRDTLGMTEAQGKKYLDGLEKRLEKL